MPSGFETLRLEVNGFRFDAIACGGADAPLVLFLHGWPSCRSVRRPIELGPWQPLGVFDE